MTMTFTTIGRRYHFEAAHWLPGVPSGHKCSRVHGHNYELEVTVGGEVKPSGFIRDFFDLDNAILPLVEKLDHRTLNDVVGLENPTAELIGGWFLKRLAHHGVTAVRVFETKDCWATVHASD